MNNLHLLLIGAILFQIAAFMPVSRVYAERDPARKLNIINGLSLQWRFGHVLFILGALLSAFALTFFALERGAMEQRTMAYAGAGTLTFGAILWSWHCVERLRDPAAFCNGDNTRWLFPTYSILTQAGLVFMGVYLMGAMPAWISWMFIGGGAGFFVLMLLFRDMPPFVYHVLTLIAAIALL